VTGRIEVYPEGVASLLAGLDRMLRRAECQHLGLHGVNIVDGQVEVKLLRPLARRPRRPCKLLGQLECQSQPVDGEDNPVVLGDRNFPANDSLVELGKCPRVGAVKNHGAYAGRWHGQPLFHEGTLGLQLPPCDCEDSPAPDMHA
jgi:hypothetical protein